MPADSPGEGPQQVEPDALKRVLDEFGVTAQKAGGRSWLVGSVLFRQNARQVFVHDRRTGFRYRLEFGFGHDAFKAGVGVLLKGFGLLPA